MFNDGNGEHMDQQSVYKYPNDTSCHIMYSSMHEHYTHIISTSKYKFNSIININNGMIIFGSIYSRRKRVMLNGIDIDDDKSNGYVATLTPSNVVFHLICLDRDEHIGITSVNNIMHRLTNTMSRCTDDVVGIDNNDNNNISIVDTNYNGTRSAKLLPSSEYGEHITSVNTNHTPINNTVDGDTLYCYINNNDTSYSSGMIYDKNNTNIIRTGTLHYDPYVISSIQQGRPVGTYKNNIHQPSNGYERGDVMHPRNIDGIESLTITCNTFQYREHDMSVHYTITITNDTSTVVSTSFDNTNVNSYTNNIKAIHQSTISFNTEAATCAGNNDVDNNESFTYNTMIDNICKSITSTNGLIISQDGEHIPLHDAVSNVVPILFNESDLTRTTRNVSSWERVIILTSIAKKMITETIHMSTILIAQCMNARILEL